MHRGPAPSPVKIILDIIDRGGIGHAAQKHVGHIQVGLPGLLEALKLHPVVTALGKVEVSQRHVVHRQVGEGDLARLLPHRHSERRLACIHPGSQPQGEGPRRGQVKIGPYPCLGAGPVGEARVGDQALRLVGAANHPTVSGHGHRHIPLNDGIGIIRRNAAGILRTSMRSIKENER